MKKLIFSLLVLTLQISQAQTTLNTAKTLNIAAKQRMLSQKMAKAKVCIALDVDAANATKELEASMTIFDEALKFLAALKTNNEITVRIVKVQNLWFEYQKNLVNPTTKSMNLVVDASADVLVACNDLVQDLKKFYATGSLTKSQYETNINDAVVTAGSLRYLSQQLALLNIYSYSNKEIDTTPQLLETNFNFEKAITNLLTCEANDYKIDLLISKVYAEWNLIKAQTATVKIEPLKMNEQCNSILALADRLTNVYVDLLDKNQTD